MRLVAKPILLLVLLCAAIGFSYFLFWPHGIPEVARASLNDTPTPALVAAPAGAPSLPPSPGILASLAPKPAASTMAAAPAPAPTPFLLGSADAPSSLEPAIVLRNMRNVISQYSSMFGGNPVGTNPEITETLNGGNPKSARFIQEESGLRINGRGELVDSWGTPFFFHQLSATEMEIRSAGPDRKMWTADDLVTK